MRHLRISIDCGATTCSPERGRWCRFCILGWAPGTSRCALFLELLEERDGWVARCERCVEHEEVK